MPTLAEIYLARGRAESDRELRRAAIEAQRSQGNTQAWAGAITGLAGIASNAIGDYAQRKQNEPIIAAETANRQRQGQLMDLQLSEAQQQQQAAQAAAARKAAITRIQGSALEQGPDGTPVMNPQKFFEGLKAEGMEADWPDAIEVITKTNGFSDARKAANREELGMFALQAKRFGHSPDAVMNLTKFGMMDGSIPERAGAQILEIAQKQPDQLPAMLDALIQGSKTAREIEEKRSAPTKLMEMDPTKNYGDPITGEVKVQGTPAAPKPSYQQDEFMLNGREVKGAFDPQTGRYLYQGQDVTDQAVPVPPRSSGSTTLSPTMEANILNRMTNQWTGAKKPAEELDRQAQLMKVGMDAARKGDLQAGAQTVLVTFQKILDPTSVVRESEYDRSAAGQSLMNRVKGALEKLTEGGAGVPLSELEKFYALAQEAVKAQNGAYLKATKERIGRMADRYNIPQNLVFEDVDVVTGRNPTAPQAPQAPTVQAPPRPAGVPASAVWTVDAQHPQGYWKAR